MATNDIAVFKGDYEVQTRHGTAVVHAPHDISAKDLAQTFAPVLRRRDRPDLEKPPQSA